MAYDVKFMDSNIRYMSNQIGCHDSRIEDHDRDLKELMGTVDIIKEEVMKLARMNQCSHGQDSLGDDARPMDDVSVTQPVGFSTKTK